MVAMFQCANKQDVLVGARSFSWMRFVMGRQASGPADPALEPEYSTLVPPLAVYQSGESCDLSMGTEHGREEMKLSFATWRITVQYTLEAQRMKGNWADGNRTCAMLY